MQYRALKVRTKISPSATAGVELLGSLSELTANVLYPSACGAKTTVSPFRQVT